MKYRTMVEDTVMSCEGGDDEKCNSLQYHAHYLRRVFIQDTRIPSTHTVVYSSEC